MAVGSERDRARRGCRAQRVLRPCRGFGRRPLDDPGGDRAGGAGRSIVGGALHAFSFAPGPYLRREDPVGDAQAIRRPSGAALGIGRWILASTPPPAASRAARKRRPARWSSSAPAEI